MMVMVVMVVTVTVDWWWVRMLNIVLASHTSLVERVTSLVQTACYLLSLLSTQHLPSNSRKLKNRETEKQRERTNRTRSFRSKLTVSPEQ